MPRKLQTPKTPRAPSCQHFARHDAQTQVFLYKSSIQKLTKKRPHLGEGLCTAHLLPSNYELQHVGLSMAHFITEALGSCQPSEHAAADDGILLSQAAAAVNWAHTPHLDRQVSLSAAEGRQTDRQTDGQTVGRTDRQCATLLSVVGVLKTCKLHDRRQTMICGMNQKEHLVWHPT